MSSRLPAISFRTTSHLTVGVACFGSNVSDWLSSSGEELPGSGSIFTRIMVLVPGHTNVGRLAQNEFLRSHVSCEVYRAPHIKSSDSCVAPLPCPYRGMTPTLILQKKARVKQPGNACPVYQLTTLAYATRVVSFEWAVELP